MCQGWVGNQDAIDNCNKRLNFDLSKKNEIYQPSWKERLKISKIEKFGFRKVQKM